MIADNSAILARLDEEERGLEAANAAMAERHASAAAARRAAEAALAESEGALGELTERHAMIAAQREQHEKTIAAAEARAGRRAAEVAALAAELQALETTDLVSATAAAQTAVSAAEGEREARDAETAAADERLTVARDAAAAAREALAEAERARDRIETEAATLAAILASSSEGRAPVVDAVSVAAGYEAALGAAFGDDLEAPSDVEAAAHWRAAHTGEGDPSLPAGVEPLARHVEAPAVLQRRLAQTGLVDRNDGAALQVGLKPGQRLVSREGDLWRWDGYVATADAPRSGAQRLARRNRLAALQAEGGPARARAAALETELDAAEAAVRAATEADREARERLRLARQALDRARQTLAEAEREENRTAARRASLQEAAARLGADREESEAAAASARAELGATGELEDLAARISEQRARVEEDRAAQAEARAAAESMAREADIRSGRLGGDRRRAADLARAGGQCGKPDRNADRPAGRSHR